MNVLIVEDDKRIQNGLKSAIHQIDCDANFFCTALAEEAISIAEKNIIDIFVLDIFLYDHEDGGLVVARKIRKMDKYRIVPLIFVTSLDKMEIEVYKYGQYFIKKPCLNQDIQYCYKEALKDTRSVVKKAPDIVAIKKKDIFAGYLLNEIVYVESMGKHLNIVICQNDGEELKDILVKNYNLKTIFADILEKDEGAYFVQCNRSYILNIRYKRDIDIAKMEIVLTKQKRRIKIGRKYMDCIDKLRGF